MDDVWLTSLFQQEFEWCHVRAGESVAIVTEPASAPSYVSLASLAAGGARPFQVMLPMMPVIDDVAVVAPGAGSVQHPGRFLIPRQGFRECPDGNVLFPQLLLLAHT